MKWNPTKVFAMMMTSWFVCLVVSVYGFVLPKYSTIQYKNQRIQFILNHSRQTDSSNNKNNKDSSRRGVRSRVKSVLKKASVRTGIRNRNEDDNIASSVSTSNSIGVSNRDRSMRDSIANGNGNNIDDTQKIAMNINSSVTPSPLSSMPKIALAQQEELNAIVEAASIGANADVELSTSSESLDTNDVSNDVGINASNNDSKETPEVKRKKYVDSELKSALMSDNSAAFNSIPIEPLPFSIPKLTDTQLALVRSGERVQEQSRMGREGNGFVVVDVQAPEDVVWGCLLDFYSYPEIIPTVRDITMYTNTHLDQDYMAEKAVEYEDGTTAVLKVGVPSVTRASFTLSKFRLKIAAIHKYRPHPKGDYMIFTLDPAMTNFVLKSAKGVWHTQAEPDGKKVCVIYDMYT